MRYLRSLLAVTIAFGACGEAPTASISTNEAEAAEVMALSDIRTGPDRQDDFQDAWAAISMNAGFAMPQYRIIADSGQFARLWTRATEPVDPKPPIPYVHFATEMVILAAYGSSGGGDHIAITRVARRDGGLVVVVVRTHPGPGCLFPLMITSPAAAAVVPRRAAPVRFIVLDRVRTCS